MWFEGIFALLDERRPGDKTCWISIIHVLQPLAHSLMLPCAILTRTFLDNLDNSLQEKFPGGTVTKTAPLFLHLLPFSNTICVESVTSDTLHVPQHHQNMQHTKILLGIQAWWSAAHPSCYFSLQTEKQYTQKKF